MIKEVHKIFLLNNWIFSEYNIHYIFLSQEGKKKLIWNSKFWKILLILSVKNLCKSMRLALNMTINLCEQ